MSHVAASELAFAHPGGDDLFSEVSFTLAPGSCVGLVGANGVGKSTLLEILSGRLPPTRGAVSVGGLTLHMSQRIGVNDSLNIRELLDTTLPPPMARARRAMSAAERELAAGDTEAGVRLGLAIADWSELGGYQLEAAWDEACRRVLGRALVEVAERPVAAISGGERKQLVLEVLFSTEAQVLLLDEPDNHLDIPAKRALERRLRTAAKTVVLVSHDRELLTSGVSSILTLEDRGCWLHGDSYATYQEARAGRRERMGNARKRWEQEEQRLRDLVRTFKERARYSSDWGSRAKAMQSRWERWVSEPPPKPVKAKPVTMRFRGRDSARRVARLVTLGFDELLDPFDHEIYLGEHVGLIGPNGTGKSHLLRLLAGEPIAHTGGFELGPRVLPGHFTQHNTPQGWDQRTVIEIVKEHTGDRELAMRPLARYGLADAADRSVDKLSGGQKARLEILGLELAGCNFLLLDEPTDNLDIDSCEAIELALAAFAGTVLAASHDRTFLRHFDRFLYVGRDGRVTAIADADRAIEVLSG